MNPFVKTLLFIAGVGLAALAFKALMLSPEDMARTNASHISSHLEDKIRDDLGFSDVTVGVDSEDKTLVVISGAVSSQNDMRQIKTLIAEEEVDFVPIRYDVVIKDMAVEALAP